MYFNIYNMEIKKFYEYINEARNSYSNKNLIFEICTSMLLLNNEFLSNILDRGMKARYQENSQVFLTDLKNLLIAKNRLSLGKFIDGKCVVDEESSKISSLFEGLDFDIEKDWNLLNNSRITARNIIDKLLPDEKLESDRIRNIFWIGPNKNELYDEDIVIELNDGKQYSFYLNKNLSQQKTASFNTFMDNLIGNNVDKMYGNDYIQKWNKLVKEWVRIIYENSNLKIQKHIDKFIDIDRIDSLTWFGFFEIKHRDDRFKHLGEFIPEVNKNILYFSDLLNEIWKNKELCFMDVDKFITEWYEVKIFVLNSKILENILTNSLKTNYPSDIKKTENELKLSDGGVKMKLFKTLVEKMDCQERSIYYLNNNGNNFNQVPSREFFRNHYDDMDLKFDYHVKFHVDENEEANNDFRIKIVLELDHEELITMSINVKFTGGELNDKLSAKYKFDLSPKFNYLVSRKENKNDEIH